MGVVIPSYRNSRFLRKTVLSLFAQDWPHWQAVVVDDGTPEPSRKEIADLLGTPRLRYFWKPNGGVASARNFGWQKLPRELSYLMFLDGDDVLTPMALRRMIEELRNHPRAGMVHCEPLLIDEDDNVISDHPWPPRWSWGPRMLKPTDRITPFESIYTLAGVIPSLAMIRREVYEETPGWDENFGQHCEDTDLFLHIALHNSVRYLPEKLVCHRRHAMQSTAASDRFARQEAKLYAKWRGLGKASPEQRQIIARAEWFRIGPLAARLGLDEARRYLVDGEVRTAVRFFLGAIRRKLRSIILGPETELTTFPPMRTERHP